MAGNDLFIRDCFMIRFSGRAPVCSGRQSRPANLRATISAFCSSMDGIISRRRSSCLRLAGAVYDPFVAHFHARAEADGVSAMQGDAMVLQDVFPY